LRIIGLMILGILVLGSSALPQGNETERVRVYTRGIEFNYISWALNAIRIKVGQIALGTSSYLSPNEDHDIVVEYLGLVAKIQDAENKINDIYANPNISNPEVASSQDRQELQGLKARRQEIGPLAESIIQSQISVVAADLGLTLGGQPIPPVLYHSTALPLALIVSPRNVIRQDEDISLEPDLTAGQKNDLETQVDQSLNVSSLVVNIGGIGIYPTMVEQTNDLNFLTEVVAHEWTHNYLTLRPLGISYLSSPELRTMNETTASISGKEIGKAVMERYYPELIPPPASESIQPGESSGTPQPPAFDFRAEMHLTRITVDRLLAEGKITEAESYMDEQRVVFWNHGYHIRKLNQAYFAFYGAYADQPGGAAGNDPVGAAVRALRAHSRTLAEFINRISWMSSFEQLQNAVNQYSPQTEVPIQSSQS
jgi:hypothetical protein